MENIYKKMLFYYKFKRKQKLYSFNSLESNISFKTRRVLEYRCISLIFFNRVLSKIKDIYFYGSTLNFTK